jgi:hypothetical protein
VALKRWGMWKWIIPLIIIGIIFIIFSGFTDNKEKQAEKNSQITDQLSPILSVQKRNEEINFLIAVENKSNHTVTLTFPTSKMFDITVKDSSGKETFKHSIGKNYSQKQEKVEIQAGESHIWRSDWKLPSNIQSGIYQIEAVITPTKISPGSINTEKLSMNETLTLHSQSEKLENNSFRKIHFTGSDGNYKVSGEARVFEAVFAYTVTDGHTVYEEQHTKVAEGAPAWAPFSLNIHVPEEDLPINGTLILELYYFSPKDGEKTDVIAVPLQTFK